MQSPSKRLLVLDTWVLATVATFGNDWLKATDVLTKILKNCHSVVFDFNNEVMHEYEPYINKQKWLEKWYKEMNKQGKIKLRPDNAIALTAYVTDDDMKFVRLATSLPGPRIIISGDSDFTNLKQHPDFVSRGIQIRSLDDCDDL